MAGVLPERKAVGIRFYLFILTAGLLFAPRVGFAQSVALSGSQGTAEAVRFQILNQRRVFFGKHSVTLNRVAPPVFPAPVPTPTPPLADLPPSPITNYVLLCFSATVYDHQFTVIQWVDGNAGMTAVSNVDFNEFCTTGGFNEGDTSYELIYGLGNESSASADPATAAWLAQARNGLAPSVPGYLVVSGSGNADQIQALNDLHAYVAANSVSLIQAYRQSQAENAAAALRLKLHPPVRPNTVINYWPIKSSVYPTGSHQ